MPLALPRKTVDIFSQVQSPEAYKTKVFNVLGDLNDVEVLYNAVLIAAYIRPEKTPGGIIVNRDEDVWQGKTGLVVKLGPNAFQDDEINKFHGQRVDVGDWCAFFIQDAKLLYIKDVPCRLVEDSSIKLKVKDPAIVF